MIDEPAPRRARGRSPLQGRQADGEAKNAGSADDACGGMQVGGTDHPPEAAFIRAIPREVGMSP
jgi:hypothetical protein